jgi:hypothetical protein
MSLRTLRKPCSLVCAAAMLWCPSGHAETSKPTAPSTSKEEKASARDYVRFVGDNIRGKLETAVVTMKNAAGIQVELIGAVHIADGTYYKTLTKLFEGYETLLFELVDGQSLKQSVEGQPTSKKTVGTSAAVPPNSPKPKPSPPAEFRAEEGEEEDHNIADGKDANPAFGILRLMMQGLGSYLRLEYQTDGIDYHAKNFVHADVSMDEFLRLQEEKGESFATIFQKAIEAEFKRSADARKDQEPTGGQLLLALLGDSSGIKIAMARMLGKAEDLSEDLGFGPDSVIVGERNRVALEIFDRQVKAGRKNMGIFYGAAHLSDMENRLEKRGYRRTGERWVTAWDIKPAVDEKKGEPTETKPAP